MPIPTKTPITPVEPEKKYDRVAITLSISPIPEPGGLTGAASLLLTPYRVLKDGTTEMRPDLAWSHHVPDVNALAEKDPKFADEMQTLFNLVTAFAERTQTAEMADSDKAFMTEKAK